LLAAAAVWRGAVTRDLLAELTGLEPRPLQVALEELLGRRLLKRESGAASCFSLVGARPRRAALGIDGREWSELHRRAAGLVQERGPEPWLRFLHMLSAEPQGEGERESGSRGEILAGLRAELEDLRTRGCSELALDLSTRIEDEALREAYRLPAVLAAELTLTWAVLGEVELAEERLAAASDASPAVQALESRTRARIATLRQQHDLALEHLGRAADLDPANAAHALQAEARLHYEARRDDELESLATEVKTSRRAELPQIVAVNLASLVAMARFRRGEVDEALEGLAASVAEAERLGEDSHEAGDRINLGIVLRHTGRLEEATMQLERALQLNDRAGFQPGVTQAQSMLAGVLRDRGELVRAESLAVAAADARERVGDAAGAERARALVGLVLAERGHVRAAATTLEGSAQALRNAGAESDAAWLAARAVEMRARFSARAVEGSEMPAEFAADDPRIGVALARASWLGGDANAAARLARAASARARELSRRAPGEDAALLLSLLEGDDPLSGPDFETPAVNEDARVLSLLSDAREPERLKQALELAEELAQHGRDDRSARLALSVIARSADDDQRRAARRLAADGLDRCALGCDDRERQTLLEHLLGIPDPQPEDLQALASDEDWDMDVLTLLDINQRLVEQQDLPRLLGSIVENALEVTGAERGFLVLEEDGEFSLDLAMDSRRGDIDEPEVEVSYSVLREVLERGQALRLSNAAQDPILGAAPSVSALELRSVLCQPFAVGDGVRGVIYLDNRLREGAFSERAERLLGLLAGQAALAIRQVRRVERIAELNEKLEQEVVTKESDLRTARRALVAS
ncbi:MAG: GAF domain-containing protein, partial [Planctomycetota bacterium]